MQVSVMAPSSMPAKAQFEVQSVKTSPFLDKENQAQLAASAPTSPLTQAAEESRGRSLDVKA